MTFRRESGVVAGIQLYSKLSLCRSADVGLESWWDAEGGGDGWGAPGGVCGGVAGWLPKAGRGAGAPGAGGL